MGGVYLLPKDARCRWPGCGVLLRADTEDSGVHAGRSLCVAHHHAATLADTLADYPRLTRSSDEVMVEWEILRTSGVTTRTEAARRIGMSIDAFDRALLRARAAGDPRAVWAPRSDHPVAVLLAERAAQRHKLPPADRRAG